MRAPRFTRFSRRLGLVCVAMLALLLAMPALAVTPTPTAVQETSGAGVTRTLVYRDLTSNAEPIQEFYRSPLLSADGSTASVATGERPPTRRRSGNGTSGSSRSSPRPGSGTAWGGSGRGASPT